MKSSDYPSTYRASDKCSLKAQSTYIILMGFDLLSMIIGALLSIYNYQSEQSKLWVYIISAILLLIATILTFIIKLQKFEDTWYQGRALAESAKTLTWRYLTCSDNFEKHLSQDAVNKKFILTLGELVREFQELNSKMSAKLLALPNITQLMKTMRDKSYQERKDFYLEHRIREQKEWYSAKADYNKGKQNMWFWIIIFSQLVALVCAIYLIKHPESNWNFVGLLTTFSAAVLAWLQLKQHQELNQAYTTATQELNLIEELSSTVQDEQSLTKFVLDAENAISREHTLWLAQRRK